MDNMSCSQHEFAISSKNAVCCHTHNVNGSPQVCYNLNSVASFSKKNKVSIPKLTVDGSNNN